MMDFLQHSGSAGEISVLIAILSSLNFLDQEPGLPGAALPEESSMLDPSEPVDYGYPTVESKSSLQHTLGVSHPSVSSCCKFMNLLSYSSSPPASFLLILNTIFFPFLFVPLPDIKLDAFSRAQDRRGRKIEIIDIKETDIRCHLFYMNTMHLIFNLFTCQRVSRRLAAKVRPPAGPKQVYCCKSSIPCPVCIGLSIFSLHQAFGRYATYCRSTKAPDHVPGPRGNGT